MATTCSHVLLWVHDIHVAVEDFRRLGFKVDYATHPAKAQHAHIWFTHGPVIELLTTPRNARLFKWPIELMAGRGAGTRMLRWPQEGEGFCDVAVVADASDLNPELAALRADGVQVGRAVGWKRTRPDGQKIAFQFAYPRHDRLPFLVSPYDPPQHPAHTVHANGATALTRVRMGVSEDDVSALRRIIGNDPHFALELAPRTGVLGIELAGLRVRCDPALSHGADIRPASADLSSHGVRAA